MNDEIKNNLIQQLSGKYVGQIIFNDIVWDKFTFEFKELKFELFIIEQKKRLKMKLFLITSIAFNFTDAHAEEKGAGIYEACLGINRNKFFKFDDAVLKIADWVFSVHGYIFEKRTHDHGYSHGFLGIFEYVCSKNGISPICENIDFVFENFENDLIGALIHIHQVEGRIPVNYLINKIWKEVRGEICTR